MAHSPSLTLARLSFGSRTRERCWKKIGRQMAATHLPLEHCFAMQARRAREDRALVAPVFEDIVRSLNEGHSVGLAIAPYASPEEVMLIDAGQTAGEAALAQGFVRAAAIMEKRRTIRDLVVKELVYPAALLVAMCAFLAVVATVLIPKLAVLSDPATWQGAGALLHRLSLFVTGWQGAATLGLLVLLGLAVALSLPRWTGRLRALADHVPPWSIYRLLTGVSWLYATAILLQAREMKLGFILRRLLATPDTSPYLRWRLLPVIRNDDRGLTLGEALHASPDHWPDRNVVDDLRTYSALPGFNTMLAGIAEELMNDNVERVRKLARILGGIALFGIIGLMVLLVIGLFGIQEQITGSVGSMGGL